MNISQLALKHTAVAALLTLIAACGHVPVSTIAKLRSFDPLGTDVAVLRVAMSAPDWLEPVPSAAFIELTAKERGKAEPLLQERFQLEPAGEGHERDQLKTFEKKGYRIWAFRLPKGEAERLRAIQAQMRAMRAVSNAQTPKRDVALTTQIKGCRRGEGATGPVIASTYLKPDAETGYLVLLRDIDLRKMAMDAGANFDAETPPCGKII